ncbi:MAG: hypothetical protein MUE42_11405 [Opitutaceae bacterium]|nr:hypothetical protein [Opitutaceae bacterium]
MLITTPGFRLLLFVTLFWLGLHAVPDGAYSWRHSLAFEDAGRSQVDHGSRP